MVESGRQRRLSPSAARSRFEKGAFSRPGPSSPASVGVDPDPMPALLVMCFAVLLAVCGPAQERRASVVLDDGEQVEGVVLALDLQSVQLKVGGEVRTFAATRIRECRIETLGAPGSEPAARSAAAGADPSQGPSSSPRGEKEPGQERLGGAPDRQPPAGRGKVSWQGPVPDVVGTEEAPPHDVRGVSLWRLRMQRLDDAYPWLVPAAPQQWFSLGLLLAILLSFFVHVSVRVVGCEGATMQRSVALAAWFMMTAGMQAAYVPVTNLTIVLMLLGNSTMALFWLSGLFGLQRVHATIAFAVQLGFVALGIGVLELVTAVLASIHPAV